MLVLGLILLGAVSTDVYRMASRDTQILHDGATSFSVIHPIRYDERESSTNTSTALDNFFIQSIKRYLP